MMEKNITYITDVTDIKTNCSFMYIVNNKNVYLEWIHWQKNNPGPYTFLIRPHENNKKNE